ATSLPRPSLYLLRISEARFASCLVTAGVTIPTRPLSYCGKSATTKQRPEAPTSTTSTKRSRQNVVLVQTGTSNWLMLSAITSTSSSLVNDGTTRESCAPSLDAENSYDNSDTP